MKLHTLPNRQIHLDFHTSPEIKDVGVDFDADEFADRLVEARVNSVTLFAKCHHGHLYYDTKHPARHPHLPKNLDLLGEQLEACRRRGIRAPIYLSVQCDEFAANMQPGWRVVNEKGELAGAPFWAGWHLMDMSSPYAGYLADQIAEVLKKYRPVDEIFLDMCWDQPSCSVWAIAGMRKAGLDPEKAEDRNRFALDVVHGYMERYNKLVRDLNGGKPLPVWYNSRPKVKLPVEKKYLQHVEIESLPTNIFWGYSYFPVNIRFARNFGLICLGMTGRFHKDWADFGGLKPKAALLYETSQMLAHGARCSVGDQLHPRGTLDKAAYDLIGHAYKHVEACEPWCLDAKPVTQIAVLRNLNAGYQVAAGEALEGTLKALQQLGHQFDYLPAMDEVSLAGYEAVIVTHDIVLTDKLAAKLRAFVKAGGALLIEAAAAFRDGKLLIPELGVQSHGLSPYQDTYLRFGPAISGPEVQKADHVMYERGLRITPTKGAVSLAKVVEPYFDRRWDHFSSHHQTPPDKVSRYAAAVQKGRTITLAYSFFKAYASHANIPYRQLLEACLNRLVPAPLTRFTGPRHVEVTLTSQGRRTIAHVLSFCPQRRAPNIDIVEEVFPLVEAKLEVKLPRRPKSVTIQPIGLALPFAWSEPYAQVSLSSTRGHDMIVFE
jgi:hypothetical protein